MLFFVDETWQRINGVEVGALGAVAIPQARYNAFCREVYAIKRNVLGASEFTDSEFKGQTCLAKSVFKRQANHADSWWYAATMQLFDALEKHSASVFVIWTRNANLLTLRNPHSTALSKPYKQLLFDLRAYMQSEASGRLATVNFDQRQHRDDEATARAVSNFLIRTSGRLESLGQVLHHDPKFHRQFHQPRSSSRRHRVLPWRPPQRRRGSSRARAVHAQDADAALRVRPSATNARPASALYPTSPLDSEKGPGGPMP